MVEVSWMFHMELIAYIRQTLMRLVANRQRIGISSAATQLLIYLIEVLRLQL